MSKLFEKYADKIRNNTLGESDIIALRSHMNGGRRNSTLTEYERTKLSELVYDLSPRIMSEQSAKGLRWLLDQYRTPRGVLRKNNPFGTREIHVLEHFSHFTLSGFWDSSVNHYPSYLPCYTVHATDGSKFTYVPYGGNYSCTGSRDVHIIN